ncbi:hypothetical protein [Alphaproteobacteria bacterium endosymbiont of Tiliacea citrago]|uniref:hypothetical protein n=1 Tax=Alphaproteobacteria bacterium endosymbiont of Tiliacea citrago TaxID=3077944 RepID=UPI00313BDD6B
MNNFKYISLFLVATLSATPTVNPTDFFSNIDSRLNDEQKIQSAEIQTHIQTLSEKVQELKTRNSLLDERLANSTKNIFNYEQLNNKLTAENVNLKSENKRIEKENTELKQQPFLPRTAAGWAGLGLIVLGTVLVIKMYYTLYC